MTDTPPPPAVPLDALAAEVPDGSLLAIPKDEVGAPVAATLALLRRGVGGLRLLCVPTGGLPAELLIGAGAVATLETSAVTLGEAGFAPRFRAAVESGRIAIRDATCPAIYAALQAGEKGAPFAAVRGLIGSDVLANRPDWRVIQNPFAEAADPVVLVPALRPDVALIHCRTADRFGNVWAGDRHEAKLLAHAAHATLCTVEEIVDGNLMADERTVADTIPPLYLTAVALAPRGAWPCGLAGRYRRDGAALAAYAEAARSEDGFSDWLARAQAETREAA